MQVQNKLIKILKNYITFRLQKNIQMKNRLFSLLLLLLITSYSYSQNEYRYIALRFGISNGFSGQPEMNPNKYLNAPSYLPDTYEEMQLAPVASFMGWTPGFNGSILYHFDFHGDAAGIITGIDYNYTGITSKYETLTRGYTLTETHRMHMIGVPVAIKYGPDIWDTQRYVYAGAQFNFIAAMNAVQKVSWNTTPSSTKLEGDEFKKTTFSLFFGVNWKVLNVQFDFYPASIFNDTYTEANLVTSGEFLKYEGQVKQFFTIKAGLNIPYGWLSENSFWWRRFLRNKPWK